MEEVNTLKNECIFIYYYESAGVGKRIFLGGLESFKYNTEMTLQLSAYRCGIGNRPAVQYGSH